MKPSIKKSFLIALTLLALTFSSLKVTPAQAGTNTWSATDSLETGRRWTTLTLLPDGKVLAVGGWDAAGELDSAEVYDPGAGAWSAANPSSSAHGGHTATLLDNGKVLVVGGSTKNAELYDPTTGAWSSAGTLDDLHSFHTATLLTNGKVLVVAGIGTASVELYDPATNTWTITDSLSAIRGYHIAALLSNGKVLIAGGEGVGTLSNAELYDPVTGTWSAAPSMSNPRKYHFAATLTDGKVLVAGGRNYSSSQTSAELYDPDTNTWSATGSMNVQRSYSSATLLADGQVLVSSGETWTSPNTSEKVSSAELYDPATGTWTNTASLSTARIKFGAVQLADGRVLVAGGEGSTYLSNVEIYDGPAPADTTAPTVVDVYSETPDGAYKAGDAISVFVQFSEPLEVDTTGGVPSLCFETGTVDQCVDYDSGSGSDTLAFFDYVVQAGDHSIDLEYVDVNSLFANGASIADEAENDADLTLPDPGAPGSFSDNNDFVIDAIAPTASVDSGPSDPTTSTEATFEFSASDDVTPAPNLVFWCDLDGIGWEDCSGGPGSWSYTSLDEGIHTFTLNAVDEVGNSLDPNFVEYTWEIDLTAPDAPVVTGSSAITADSTPTIGGTAEAGSWVNVWYLGGSGWEPACQDVLVDGAGGWSCESSVTMAEGAAELAVNVTDEAGNTSADRAHFFIVDLTPPVLDVTLSGASSNSSVWFIGQAIGYTSFNILATVANTGGAVLEIGTISVDNTEFAITDNTCNGASLGSSESCSFEFAFAPSSMGDKIGEINIPHNASGSPYLIGLQGTPYTPPTFADVPGGYWAYAGIERLGSASITGGCYTDPVTNDRYYCPDNEVTRAEMAVFLMKGMYGWFYTPADVTPTFTDTVGHWAENWIEALRAEGITGGCGTNLYCPDNKVTRAEMAVFLLKAKYGSGYTPPAVSDSTGFPDVSASYWAAAWIKQLAAEGITGGCGGGNYCPESSVTRAQMAVFLVKTFNLP